MQAHGLVTAEAVGRSGWPTLARHFLEMVAAMWVGMVAGGLVFAPILAASEMTPSEARVRYPELYLLVMAFNMTVPMVLWMRHRGHGARSCFEMSAAMVVPGILLLCLFWVGATDGPACGLYCGLMAVSMLVLMLYRRDESHDHRGHEVTRSQE